MDIMKYAKPIAVTVIALYIIANYVEDLATPLGLTYRGSA